MIILGQIFLKSPLRQDELRQTNGQGSTVRQYPKQTQKPHNQQGRAPAKVNRCTKYN